MPCVFLEKEVHRAFFFVKMDIIVTFTSYFNYCLVYKISKKIPKTDKKISW